MTDKAVVVHEHPADTRPNDGMTAGETWIAEAIIVPIAEVLDAVATLIGE